MHILFWGREESFENLSQKYLSDDLLIDKCILPDTLNKRSDAVSESACVLILDGNYEYMFDMCKNLGYHMAQIIDFPKYLLYKDLEHLLSERNSNLNGREATELWYDILSKVITSYDHNGEVIGACKNFFEKKLASIDYNKFWD